MQTFECPKCGAPVTYDPSVATSAQCTYCQSQLAVPNAMLGHPARVISQIEINVGPQVAATASKAIWFVVLIPVVIVVIVLGGVFGAISQMRRALTPLTQPTSARDKSSGSHSDPNVFANETMTFGSEGIGPGMMTDARSIAVDGQGNIYVGEYSGGRIQVFDANGKFITQWIADPKMPLRGLAVDRKGTAYVVQKGIITR